MDCGCILYMCEHGAKLQVGWMTEETGALVSIWGQNNVQNELDAVSSRSVLSFEALLAFPRISWVLYTQQYRHVIHSIRKATSGPGSAIRQ